MSDAVTADSNGNPPALAKLEDGQLCLIYGIYYYKHENAGGKCHYIAASVFHTK